MREGSRAQCALLPQNPNNGNGKMTNANDSLELVSETGGRTLTATFSWSRGDCGNGFGFHVSLHDFGIPDFRGCVIGAINVLNVAEAFETVQATDSRFANWRVASA